VHSELREIQGIAQTTLDHVRSLSQSLHPVMLEEIGLESTIDWYIATAEKQLGLAIHYEKSGQRFPVDPSAGIHIYRVLQEALNNVARHSGVREAQVALRYHPEALELRIEDHGKGLVVTPAQPGIGLVAMRERTELLDGRIEIEKPESGGTRIRLQVPRKALGEKQEANA
jgi:signal transduction histidine kinase